MLVTVVNRRVPDYTGSLPLNDGTVLTFTNGQAGPVDISYGAIVGLETAGAFSIFTSADPVSPFDPAFDAKGAAALNSPASQMTAAARAAYGFGVSLMDPQFGAVGDGVTDDTAAVQAWLNHGGDLYAPPGTYLVNGATRPRLTTDNTTIRGAGPGITRFLCSVLYDGTPANDVDLLIVGQGPANAGLGLDGAELFNATVRDLSLEFTGANPSRGSGACVRASRVHNLTITNVLTKYGSIGIHVNRAHGFKIQNNEVDSPKADGIQCDNGSDTASMTLLNGVISGNYVHDTNDDGISVGGTQDGGVYRSQPQNVVIFGNTIGPVHSNGGGIGIYGIKGCKVFGNKIADPVSHFMNVLIDNQYNHYPSQDVDVTDNLCTSSQTAGGGSVGGPVCMWVGGRNAAFSGSELNQPFVQNLRISGNRFVVNDRSGIWCQPNSAMGSNPGMWLDTVVIEDNEFVFTGVAPAFVYRGLHLQYINNLTVRRNQIRNFPHIGVIINQFSNLRFIDNDISDCVANATYATQDMVGIGTAGTATDTLSDVSANSYRKTSGTANRMANIKATGSASYPYQNNRYYTTGATITTAVETTDGKGVAPAAVTADGTGHISPSVLPVSARALSLARRATALTETYSRLGAPLQNQAILASGTLQLVALPVTAGMVISAITFVSATTALAGGSNQWFALYDNSLNLLATTADDTSTAWAANAEKTLTLTAPFTVPSDALYYLGIVVVATTPPSLIGVGSSSVPLGMGPALAGRDNTHTGLTNPASAPAVASLSSVGGYPWANVR